MPPKRKSSTKRKANPSGERPAKRRSTARNNPTIDVVTEANPKKEGAANIYPLDQAFPHILEAIIEYSPPSSLRVLRGVSKTLKAMIDNLIPMHVTVEHGPNPKKSTDDMGKLWIDPYTPRAKSIAVVPHHHINSDAWVARRSSQLDAENKRKKEDWEARRMDDLIKALQKKPQITQALAAEIPENHRVDLKRRADQYYAWFEEQVPAHLHPAERIPNTPPPKMAELRKNLEDVNMTVNEARLSDSTFGLNPRGISHPGLLFGFLRGNYKLVHAENLLREAGNSYTRWRYSTPPAVHHILPQGWAAIASPRPYVVDLHALPSGFDSLNLQPRYLRYGPYIEPSWMCKAQNYVLVLPLCDQALAAAFIPELTQRLIVSIRIDRGNVRPIMIIPTRKQYIRNLTVIFSTTGKLCAGANTAIMRAILRDLSAAICHHVGKITFVDADCIPIDWFGADTKHTVTSEWMSDLMDGVLKDEAVEGEVFTLTKEDYMKDNGLSAAEYALQRGD